MSIINRVLRWQAKLMGTRMDIEKRIEERRAMIEARHRTGKQE